MNPPSYFERIRSRSAQRWDQLESDRELAGPWHQLFKQVQSPRHVLSELLQNADDAGATEAKVEIASGIFQFQHNGEDFTDDHFKSLCGFGYSNKRTLHTIGFRGIGFKSTFSLGEAVELQTPTLSVRFGKGRFTEPIWITGSQAGYGTTVRVKITAQRLKADLEKNLQEWFHSPISLLFFRNLRKLTVSGESIHWIKASEGPVPLSSWMTLAGKDQEKYLLARSELAEFPDEAISEIRQERMVTADEESDLPPAAVEILVGAPGRLFVVLPTGVETQLPFACNAPFIQDPARMKIKDPGLSPTNRWLLERIGKLAASAFLRWLKADLETSERAKAYGLLPSIQLENSSLETACESIVQQSFAAEIAAAKVLLTDEGKLKGSHESVIMPDALLDVWSPAEASALLDDRSRPTLCRSVSASDRKKLIDWNLIEEIDKNRVIRTLTSKHLTSPARWGQLLNLWRYLAPEVTAYYHSFEPADLKIVPAQGAKVMYAAAEVVRLGEKKLLPEADWKFLADHLIVLNQNWTRFLAEKRRDAEESRNQAAIRDIKTVLQVLHEIGLDETDDVSKIVALVAQSFFTEESKGVSLADAIRLSQIAATLSATLTDDFNYFTRDDKLTSSKDELLVDSDGTLEELLPEQQRIAQLIHEDYSKNFTSCTKDEWLRGIESGRSKLLTFLPLDVHYSTFYSRNSVERRLQELGFKGHLEPAYKTQHFQVFDWDFSSEVWEHWTKLATEDETVWSQVIERIFAQPASYWNKSKTITVSQIATTGSRRQITEQQIAPSWIRRFRDLPCLRDVRNALHRPGELMRRTAETEALMDIEPFVHGSLDTEGLRPLLNLLGVQSTPTGPDRILDILRSFSRSPKPPLPELERWYRRLDQMMANCSTADFQRIKNVFANEKLIFTEDDNWVTAFGVFLSSGEEDIPGASIVRRSVEALTLWRKVGVADRPTADLALEWLRKLPSGKELPQDDVRRVKAFLRLYPTRIWLEAQHWLNLSGEWVPVEGLKYAVTMQSLITYRHLHESVKQDTADLQTLSSEINSAPPFSALQSLSSSIEERPNLTRAVSGKGESRPWLVMFGTQLRCLQLEDQAETDRVRSLAAILARTKWEKVPGLETVPYIRGVPAGTARRTDVVWLDGILYVDAVSNSKLAKRVPEEISRLFGLSEIKAALDYAYDRTPDQVRDYMLENFSLSAVEETPSDFDKEPPTTEEESPLPNEVGAVGIAAAAAGSAEAQRATFSTSVMDSIPVEEKSEEEAGDVSQAENKPVRAEVKPPKSSIIERFARANGFNKDNDDRFFRDDGSWISRVQGATFPWECHGVDGSVIRYYWVKDHCLEREPLELSADAWTLLEQTPEKYSLIVSDGAGNPVELSGTKLLSMREKGSLKLFPASYRIAIVD